MIQADGLTPGFVSEDLDDGVLRRRFFFERF